MFYMKKSAVSVKFLTPKRFDNYKHLIEPGKLQFHKISHVSSYLFVCLFVSFKPINQT